MERGARRRAPRLKPSLRLEQPFLACRGQEAVVERHDGDGLAQLLLEEQAAGDLNRVTGTKSVSVQERSRPRGDLRCDLHHHEGGKIGGDGGQRAIALGGEKAPSRARRSSAEATSTSDRRLVAGVSETSSRRILSLASSRT